VGWLHHKLSVFGCYEAWYQTLAISMGPESIFQIVLASLLTQKPMYLSP